MAKGPADEIDAILMDATDECEARGWVPAEVTWQPEGAGAEDGCGGDVCGWWPCECPDEDT